MEQIMMVQCALRYIEENLTLIQDVSEIAKRIDVPGSDLQNSFNVMVGYSLSEYIRNRRLYEAAKEIVYSSEKVIDVALKYGYESPDSFTKAFYRFHGVLPSKIIKMKNKVKVFRPIIVDHYVNGGFEADYRLEQKYAFKLIGIPYSLEGTCVESLRSDFQKRFKDIISLKRMPQNHKEQLIVVNRIGEYGIYDREKQTYIIAGLYVGGESVDGFNVYEFEAMKWAVCEQYGAASEVDTERMEQIMAEDIAAQNEYRIKQHIRIERYSSFVEKNKRIHCTVELPVVEEKTESLAVRGLKIINIVSVILIILALILGGRNYKKNILDKADVDLLCSIAQYASVIDKVEGGNG